MSAAAACHRLPVRQLGMNACELISIAANTWAMCFTALAASGSCRPWCTAHNDSVQQQIETCGYEAVPDSHDA